MLNTWDVFWGLRIEQCPCDVHFVEWLEENAITNKTIYHFGSGGHHYVGIRCAEPELNNPVLSITASTPEYESWIKLAKDQPELTKMYSCYFGDIYTSNARLLPRFDVVTLFHSCEFRNEKNDAYGALTDLEVMQLFTDQTEVGGYILFYTGSFAFASAEPIIAEWAKTRGVEKVGLFKTLLVYRKTRG
ncbi:MAG: hypothetical protein ACRC56_10930 [Bosea sp. (in: a-proteobacteria)]